MWNRIERVNPASLFRGHWKVLSNRGLGPQRSADVVARLAAYGVPLGAGCAVWLWGSLSAPGSILSALSLFAAGLLTAFTYLATWRDRLTERAEYLPDAEALHRDHLDETVTHLVAAAYVSILAAIALVIGMNTRPEDEDALEGLAAAVPTTLGAYVAILILIALPRLYYTYTSINHVRRELSGH